VLIPWLVEDSLRWAGVGIPAGMLLALVAYLIAHLFHQEKGRRKGSRNQILLIALLSAIVAHFVEIQFGIAITATRTYFWLYAALLAIIGHRWQQRPEPFGSAQGRSVEREETIPEAATETLPPDSSRQRRGRRRRGRRRDRDRPSVGILARLSGSAVSYSLLVGLILATTGFDLVTHQFDLRVNGPVVFGLLFAIWLLGGILALISNLESPISNLSTYALGSLFCFLPFIAVHAVIVLPGAGIERATAIYYAYLFSVIFAVAVALMTGSNPGLPVYRFRAWWLYPIIGIGVFLLVSTQI